MAGDSKTIARPYAEAVFARADESDEIQLWSDRLELLSTIAEDEDFAAMAANPLVDRQALAGLIFDLCGDQLGDEGRNLVTLLVENKRFRLMPEIAALYAALKADKDRQLNVHIRSAYTLKAAQKKQIADVLQAKTGRAITITSEKDPDLIGGMYIKAGDLVIDGSVQGQLQRLAYELGL